MAPATRATITSMNSQSTGPLPSTSVLPTPVAIVTQSTTQQIQPTSASLATYKILVDVMIALRKESNVDKVGMPTLGEAIRKRNRKAYTGKLKKWLEGAEKAGIIIMHPWKPKIDILVELCPLVLLSRS